MKFFGLGVDPDLVILELGLFGGMPDGVLQAPILSTRPRLQGLLAGEHAPGGQFVDRLLQLRAAGGDHVPLEDAVDVRSSSLASSCVPRR